MLGIKTSKEHLVNLNNQINNKSRDYFKSNYLFDYNLPYEAKYLIEQAFRDGANLILSQIKSK